ncbi:hypothetical protein BU24DRAFT_454382 [Aaosphaeria arxii CBS 175.79]|uniref:Uncharacterized protein n=1 Tax=Aaosphaeria arxii CBS 175.79 TaxID=1450172 RepID=A0A6A5XD80_9PLEO|nr:uncharacterized protein BU24DRAFT_454382 [Aaosphaeria arxii CBS 175.79]KAF2010823.1 hypothetical protein BU24DRAFT_454382 [Aaosphaeria arxii CBS 175.79]
MDEMIGLFRTHQNFFLGHVKTYVVCAIVEGDLQIAPEQLQVIRQSIKELGLSNALLYYERTMEHFINTQTHFGTVLVDGRLAEPRTYVEDRDVTDAKPKSPTWQGKYVDGECQYELVLDGVILSSQNTPPVNEYIWMQEDARWIQWDGYQWV